MCQGFMRWIDAEGKEFEECPYIGAAEMTVKSGFLIQGFIRKTKEGTTVIKPEEF